MSASKKWIQPAEEREFWERLAGMPVSEAEQECVMRREGLILQMNMLQAESAWLKQKKQAEEVKRIGEELLIMGRTIAVLNEKIRYYRRVIEATNWSKAVAAVGGQELWDACREWMVATEVRQCQQN